ncbi:F-box only protein 47, partial [Dryobates pubescens]
QSCGSLDAAPQGLSAFGYFQTLPLEIFQMVLNYLSVRDISMLSMVSKSISGHLVNYISSSSGNRRLLLQDFHSPQPPTKRGGSPIVEHYRSLGLLLKRCTLLLPTRDRLKFIHRTLSEVSCFKLSGCPSPLQCLGLQCYGVFLQTLTAGWDELECHRVFNFLCELSNLQSVPRTGGWLSSAKPGSTKALLPLICLLLAPARPSPGLHAVEAAFCPSPQAEGRAALTDTCCRGEERWLGWHVVWQKMSEGPADESSLKGLAGAIELLHHAEPSEWTADDVVSLLDELSAVPRLHGGLTASWPGGNAAQVVRAVSGRAVELARLMVFLTLVCEKDLYCMDWAVKMMQKVCKVFATAGERNNFLQCVENAFAHMAMDMLQAVLAGGDGEGEDSSFFNLFHLMNAQASFHKEILYLTM